MREEPKKKAASNTALSIGLTCWPVAQPAASACSSTTATAWITEAMRTALADKDNPNVFNDVYETLALDTLYPDASNLVLFEGNHDMARLFSVVGEDFDQKHIDELTALGVDTSGIERTAGETFHWVGKYAPELATRETIEAAIAQLGYEPNPIARSLVTRSTQTIALLLPDIANPFYAELVGGIQRSALSRQTLEPSARALGHFAAERSPTSNCQLGSNVRLDVFAPFLHPITLARIAAAERWIGIGFFEIEQDEEALA